MDLPVMGEWGSRQERSVRSFRERRREWMQKVRSPRGLRTCVKFRRGGIRSVAVGLARTLRVGELVELVDVGLGNHDVDGGEHEWTPRGIVSVIVWVKGQNVCLARRVAGVRFGLFECRLSGCSRCR